ncbi:MULTISPECIES: FKBP-type peptidyl-prolyl cis-trans isomerase [Chryseobacterium]|uniref:Peptidyl-prolyl cis-trans isomerase n=1 Tax=Chryseobacterium geocarposphaerae TaxID=1416776 RepID=A0ABU1LI90_9FLAO|nr:MULTISPECIES: FKBP-type peptidyl-prolyl cis-trans isomerase [Chryseobacterium]MDR6406453.1 FKBP-type peptidyl-prolyl cis-trans isomerase FklB [Chryseobacterium geocarposphaerae]MDR6699889.1 FKBP-type peptidyl-prolyl cis-trans isomerase FklB [Chryseobacterium ginsenosidimutans]
MKKTLITLVLLTGVNVVFAQKTYTDEQKASYYIGLDIAQNMKKQGFPADADLLAQAIKDEFSDKPRLFPKEEMGTFLQGFMQKQNEKKQAQEKIKAEENKKKSAEFLAKNKLNKNVKTTPSGLQYEVLKEGDGKAKPTGSSTANVTYTGKLMDGTVFDSTDKNGGKPIELNLSGVIKGWTEGIQLMSKGAKYRFYIPSELAYGDNGAGGVIPPGAALIFDVELVDFK